MWLLSVYISYKHIYLFYILNVLLCTNMRDQQFSDRMPLLHKFSKIKKDNLHRYTYWNDLTTICFLCVSKSSYFVGKTDKFWHQNKAKTKLTFFKCEDKDHIYAHKKSKSNYNCMVFCLTNLVYITNQRKIAFSPALCTWHM